MRHTTLLFTLSTLALAACTDSTNPVSPTNARAPGLASLTRDASPARPISGSCDLTVTPLPSAPPILHQTDTGTCDVSHLGRTAFAGVLELNLATLTQHGERTLTAANGDILRIVSVGTSTPAGPGLVHFAATLTFVGGTGRFANATGEASAEGTANLVTSKTQMTFEGSIAYDASDRGRQ
jgi:hypothetical protein